MLYAEQFLDPAHAATTATLSPAPLANQHVSWKLSNVAIALADTSASSPAQFAPSPPPGGTYVIGETPGTATLTGSIDGIPGATASLPVYYYPSIDFGCDFRATPIASFEGSAPVTSPAGADAYMTGPAQADPLSQCSSGPLLTAAGTDYVWHFPYGATLTADGDDAARPIVAGVARAPFFPQIPASAWVNSFTSIGGTQLVNDILPCGNQTTACRTIGAGVVLFKTQTGAVVKFDIRQIINGGDAAIGPYEVSAPGGAFPY